MEGMHINGLPDEMLAAIFSYLNQKNIVKSVLPVCQRWQDVSQSLVLSKHLMLCHHFSVDQALRLVEAIPNLKSLELQRQLDATELLQAVARQCRQLRRLEMQLCTGRGVALTAALLTVFRSCSEHLTDLSLICVDIADSLLFCHGLCTSLSKLHQLTINDCEWFGPAELDVLLNSCSQMEKFTTDYLCSDAEISALVQCWGSSLQVLFLTASELTDAGVAALAGCSQLRSLHLSSLRSSGAGLQKLANLMNLEWFTLVMSYNVQAKHIQQFVTHSRSGGRLRNMELSSSSRVDDSVLIAVAGTCPNVEVMDVSSCERVTFAGLMQLLRGCRRLVRLNVRGTADSVRQVLPHLPDLAPQLRRLEMTGLLKETYQLMREKMPELELL